MLVLGVISVSPFSGKLLLKKSKSQL